MMDPLVLRAVALSLVGPAAIAIRELRSRRGKSTNETSEPPKSEAAEAADIAEQVLNAGKRTGAETVEFRFTKAATKGGEFGASADRYGGVKVAAGAGEHSTIEVKATFAPGQEQRAETPEA